MHLYRRNGHPVWQFKFEHRGVPVRRSTRLTNRRDALAFANDYRAKFILRKQGVPLDEDVDESAVLLSTLTERYLAFAKDDHEASATEDVRVVRRFTEIVGGPSTFVQRIDHDVVDQWRTRRRLDVTRRKTKVTKATVNRELNIIRAMFRQAVLWKIVAVNPCAGMKDYKVPDKEIVVYTAEELRRAFEQLPTPYNLICRVTFECLPRLAEVLRLTRDDVKIELGPEGRLIGTLSRRLKGGKRKRVPIPLDLAQALLALLDTPQQHYVFAGLEDSDAESITIIRHLRAIGLRHSHHAFRHSGVTQMLNKGITPRAIQELAGWGSLRQLQRYGHVLDAELLRASESNAAFWKATPATGAPLADRVAALVAAGVARDIAEQVLRAEQAEVAVAS